MRQQQNGFGVLGIIVLTLALSTVVFIAWKLYGSVSDPNAGSNATASAAADFYTCWDRTGSINDTKPATCSHEGKSYTAPTAFHQNQIAYLDHAPESARQQLITAAKQVFDACQSGKTPASRPVVTMAQDNFVAIRVGCDASAQRTFALEDNRWNETGNGRLALSCDTVDRYQITQKTYVGGVTEDTDLCFYDDGRSKKIPS